jgi:diguanylate cyclase (GGDEF)-like protein
LIAVDRIPGRRAVAGWQLWGLSPGLRAYVCGLIVAAAAAAGWAAAGTSWRVRDVVLWVLLAGFGAVAVELGRRLDGPDPAGAIRDVYAAWFLPVAFLLPPVYALAAPVITFALLQGRVRRTIAYRRVFSAANNGLTLAAVSVTFHALPVSTGHPLGWLLAAAGCAAAWLVASEALVITALWLADRTVSIRDLLTPVALLTDAGELAAGVLIAQLLAVAGLAVLIPALPLVVLLQRSGRRAQSDTRCDAQTGLLHADAWRADADVEVARAQRTGSPLAVGIVALSGTHAEDGAGGHPARDPVLVTASTAIRAGLRSYDRAGLMSGQEIIFLLPATTPAEARQIAGRLYASLAGLRAARTAGPAQPSVAIGIAATSNPAQTDLADLQRTADLALYRAKQASQDRICLAPTPNPDDPEEIAEAWLALGQQLRAARKRAGLTQSELARLIPYARSTIATAERGRPYSAKFWAAVDHATGADGALKAGYARIEARILAVGNQRQARTAGTRPSR